MCQYKIGKQSTFSVRTWQWVVDTGRPNRVATTIVTQALNSMQNPLTQERCMSCGIAMHNMMMDVCGTYLWKSIWVSFLPIVSMTPPPNTIIPRATNRPPTNITAGLVWNSWHEFRPSRYNTRIALGAYQMNAERMFNSNSMNGTLHVLRKYGQTWKARWNWQCHWLLKHTSHYQLIIGRQSLWHKVIMDAQSWRTVRKALQRRIEHKQVFEAIHGIPHVPIIARHAAILRQVNSKWCIRDEQSILLDRNNNMCVCSSCVLQCVLGAINTMTYSGMQYLRASEGVNRAGCTISKEPGWCIIPLDEVSNEVWLEISMSAQDRSLESMLSILLVRSTGSRCLIWIITIHVSCIHIWRAKENVWTCGMSEVTYWRGYLYGIDTSDIICIDGLSASSFGIRIKITSKNTIAIAAAAIARWIVSGSVWSIRQWGTNSRSDVDSTMRKQRC